MGNTHTVYLPPWVPTTPEEKEHADEYTKAIRAIAQAPRHFVEPDPVHQSPDFPFDWSSHRDFAEAAYRGEPRIHKLLPRLVPKRVTEEQFWRNYFSHVYAVKCRYSGSAPQPGAAAAKEDGPARLARAASMTSQIPYPRRFELAAKYVQEGPSLPADAAPGDRVLMDALAQQATIGPCNTSRPGLWDSAEAKARHEAWTKLGGMSKEEAMHLYVQALEIFRKDWVLWEGVALGDGAARPPASPPPKPPPTSAPPTAPVVGSAVAAPPPADKAATPPPRANGAAAHAAAAGKGETLYLLDISPSSRAVAVLLRALPSARDVHVVTVHRVSDLPDSVHKGCAKLPLLVDGKSGFELWDAHAIMGYLADKYAPPPARAQVHLPEDTTGKAKVQQFLAYRQATLWPAVRDHVFAQLFPSSPVCPVSRGTALREYVENAERRLQMELNRLNTVFLEGSPFLTGERPSIADLSCACAISLLDWVSSPRVSQYPHVGRWFAAVSQLPGYADVSETHKRFASTPNNVQHTHFALALIE